MLEIIFGLGFWQLFLFLRIVFNNILHGVHFLRWYVVCCWNSLMLIILFYNLIYFLNLMSCFYRFYARISLYLNIWFKKKMFWCHCFTANFIFISCFLNILSLSYSLHLCCMSNTLVYYWSKEMSNFLIRRRLLKFFAANF